MKSRRVWSVAMYLAFDGWLCILDRPQLYEPLATPQSQQKKQCFTHEIIEPTLPIYFMSLLWAIWNKCAVSRSSIFFLTQCSQNNTEARRQYYVSILFRIHSSLSIKSWSLEGIGSFILPMLDLICRLQNWNGLSLVSVSSFSIYYEDINLLSKEAQ